MSTTMESVATINPRQGRFSFLEDLEFKKQLADAEAAALAKQSNEYHPVLLDYLVFAFFCVNVALVGIAPMNYPGVVEAWRTSDSFRSDCSDSEVTISWCPTQIQLAKKALIYFHALAFTTTVSAGGIVHQFGASMAHVIGHLMFLVGCYFLQSSTARSITLGLTLHGAAGELVVNGIAPMCSIFGKATNVFIVLLSISFELSMLFYPLALYGFEAIEDMDVRREYFPSLFSYLFVLCCILTTVGTFILPVEDDGALTPYGIVAGAPMPLGFRTGRPPPRRQILVQSRKRAIRPLGAGGPMGRFAPAVPVGSSSVIPGNGTTLAASEGLDGIHDAELERLLRDAEADPPPIQVGANSKHHKGNLLCGVDARSENDDDDDNNTGGLLESSKRPALRLIAVIQKPQFLILTVIFALAAMRQSFMFANAQQLWEVGGDLGSLQKNAKWLLLGSILFSPVSWYAIDRPPTTTYALLFHLLHIAVHSCFAVRRVEFQWIATILSVLTRSLLAPVMTTLIVTYFGVKYFAALSFLSSIVALSFVFVNIPMVEWTYLYLENNFTIPNYFMLGSSILSMVLCVLLTSFYPPPKAFLSRESSSGAAGSNDGDNDNDAAGSFSSNASDAATSESGRIPSSHRRNSAWTDIVEQPIASDRNFKLR